MHLWTCVPAHPGDRRQGGIMQDYTKPVYAVDGKEFRSVSGLCNHLSRKHGADSVGGVSSDRKLAVRRGETIIAVYAVSAPVIGKPMALSLVQS